MICIALGDPDTMTQTFGSAAEWQSDQREKIYSFNLDLPLEATS